MPVKCPVLQTIAIVSDDPKLAGALSCALGRRGSYLPLLDGPRLARPDRDNEIINRVNAVARAGAATTLLAGLSSEAQVAMMAQLRKTKLRVVDSDNISELVVDPLRSSRPRLQWGRDRIGLGVLTALYSGKLIEFSDYDSPRQAISFKSEHLVICEAHEPLSEIIAANYAYSLNAGLHVFDEVEKAEASRLLESYYSIDSPDIAPARERARLQTQLRELIGPIKLPVNGSLTFITQQLPFGVAFPEIPSTHLFTYPDLGRTIINGFVAEQPRTRGTNLAVFVDPQKVRAPEIEAARKLLPARQIFVREYSGRAATVRTVKDLVDLFPYDILLFATHCGDAPGHRWTYAYLDSEGIERKLVVDIAIGVGRTSDEDLLQVTQFTRFHSLDGVDWNDPAAKKNLYVGTAIHDYIERTRNGQLEPVQKDNIKRVFGSAVMAMADENYIAMPRSLAAEGTPIIINNACVSWHELSKRFMFAGARGYIGTLYPVSDIEAEAIAAGLLGKHFGKMLAHALWSTQNAVYGNGSDRRPYVVSGVYPQRLRSTMEDVPARIVSKLWGGLKYWRGLSEKSVDDNDPNKKTFLEIAAYYEREITEFRERWFKKIAK